MQFTRGSLQNLELKTTQWTEAASKTRWQQDSTLSFVWSSILLHLTCPVLVMLFCCSNISGLQALHIIGRQLSSFTGLFSHPTLSYPTLLYNITFYTELFIHSTLCYPSLLHPTLDFFNQISYHSLLRPTLDFF